MERRVGTCPDRSGRYNVWYPARGKLEVHGKPMPQILSIPKPYVGLMGSGNSLQVRRLEDRVIIRLDPGEYFFVIFILVVAGGGLPFLAWYGFPNPHGGLFYRYAQYATGAFAVLLWYILIRYLRGMPRIEVPKGEIQFFKFLGGAPPSSRATSSASRTSWAWVRTRRRRTCSPTPPR